MSFVFKILGGFRWLFLLIGIALASLIAWFIWPSSETAQSTVKTVTITKTDSTSIRALQDSLAILRGSRISVKIRRVTVHDTLGRLITVLDSGAVQTDTLFLTHVRHDTAYVHVQDTMAVIKTPSSKKRGNLRIETYTDKSLDPGFMTAAKLPLGKLFSVNGYADYQGKKITTEDLELGIGAGMDWSILSLNGIIKNVGMTEDGFDFEVRGGVVFNF